MKQSLDQLVREAAGSAASLSSEQDIIVCRAAFLGRKGKLSALLKTIGTLPPEERPEAGSLLNEAKKQVEQIFDAALSALRQRKISEDISSAGLDLSLPGRRLFRGGLHPVSRTIAEIVEIFAGLGFEVASGPEAETEYNNFAALNFPSDHPAVDMQATFYLGKGRLLRTHTSPVQIRTMLAVKPPVQVIAPGVVYRCDSDITHLPMFHQVEGLLVDRGVSFADMKGVLAVFVREMFGPQTRLRFRPSFFPFTEPSAEIDISCVICGAAGCRVCKGSGWLEILGAGMVDPNVLRNVDYDPEVYTGYAFGLGVERVAMLKYGIDDIRLFFENDLRFLRQFS